MSRPDAVDCTGPAWSAADTREGATWRRIGDPLRHIGA